VEWTLTDNCKLANRIAKLSAIVVKHPVDQNFLAKRWKNEKYDVISKTTPSTACYWLTGYNHLAYQYQIAGFALEPLK